MACIIYLFGRIHGLLPGRSLVIGSQKYESAKHRPLVAHHFPSVSFNLRLTLSSIVGYFGYFANSHGEESMDEK